MLLNWKRKAAFKSALVLLCGLALGCDQTEEANKLVAEMNSYAVKGEAFARQGAAKQEELESTDIEKERDVVRAIAREQAGLFKLGAESLREAAGKADEAARLKVADWYRNYLTLKAQQHRKSAETLDAATERAELLASEEPVSALDEKLSQSDKRIAKLSKEEDELIAQVKKIEDEHKADFNPQSTEK